MRSHHYRFLVNLAQVLKDWLPMEVWSLHREVPTIAWSDVGAFVFGSVSTREGMSDLLSGRHQHEIIPPTQSNEELHANFHTPRQNTSNSSKLA